MPNGRAVPAPRNARRPLSFAQSGLGLRLAVALALICLVWIALLPLVLA